MFELKKLRNECLKLRHRLWKLGYTEAYFRQFLTSAEIASKVKEKTLTEQRYN